MSKYTYSDIKSLVDKADKGIVQHVLFGFNVDFITALSECQYDAFYKTLIAEQQHQLYESAGGANTETFAPVKPSIALLRDNLELKRASLQMLFNDRDSSLDKLIRSKSEIDRLQETIIELENELADVEEALNRPKAKAVKSKSTYNG